MELHRLPRKMLYGAPGGVRKRDRPRLRWLDDLEADMRNLGIWGWRRTTRNHVEWPRMVAEALVLQGL